MKGSTIKGALCLIAVLMNGPLLGGARAEMAENATRLPESVGSWTRSAGVRMIGPDIIFDYMNGAGELYLAYRFDHLEVYEYTSKKEEPILVEIYVMNSSDDAFGLLSLDWGGEPIVIYPELPSQTRQRVSPLVRALYGGGLLRLWADSLYVRIMAHRETEESKKAVLLMGRTIAMDRKLRPEPELLNVLPTRVNPGWKLREDRIGYFRSHLVLNTLYYLSHQNIFNLDHSTEAVTAPYEIRPETAPPKRVQTKRVQALFIKYATPEQARLALDHFHEVYLSEHPKGFEPGSAEIIMDAFPIEDGWVGYSLDGAHLGIVFECPDRDSAQMLIKQISNNTKNREEELER